MKSELEKLVELQITDTNIRRLKKSVETANERRAGIEQEFERHASSVREIQNRADTAKGERDELEKQIAENKTYLERANRNLKNAQNQKEYETAMREADTLQKQIGELEAKAIEKMSAVEESEGVLSERADEIASHEGNRTKALEDFETELAAAKAELETELKKRYGVFVTLPKNLAAVYDRMAQRSRDGIAVAEVKSGACSACFMSLRPQMLLEIKRGDKIITCESCARILYISSDQSSAAAE